MKQFSTVLKSLLFIFLLTIPYTKSNNVNLPNLQKDVSERSLGNPSYVVGQYWFRRLNSSNQLIDFPPAYDYLTEKLNAILVYTNLQNKHIEIGLLNNTISNAFVIPGNHLFLYSDIIQLLDTEEKLLALLAHEVAHLDAKHYERQQQNSLQEQQKVLALIGASIALTLAGSDIEAGSALWLGGIANHSENALSYSRSQEQEADRIAKHYLNQLGVNDSAMNKLFQSFSKASPRREQNEFLSTHPVPQNRAADALSTESPKSILFKQESHLFNYFNATLLVYRSLLNKTPYTTHQENINPSVKHYTDALYAWLTGNFENINSMINSLNKSNPFEAYLKTKLYIQNNEDHNALTLIREKLSLNPEDVNYLVLLAELTHSNKTLSLDRSYYQYQKKQVIDALIDHHTHHQNLPLTLAHIAQKKFHQGKTQEALAHLQRAKQLANKDELIVISKILLDITIIIEAQKKLDLPDG
ncbi:M48 family metalloprotease [Marinomonas sp. 2405UD68-3]|uniref:M48 family metalloprotease n=1 Tax=Marinomonas sp. 2405UD68-3 TaxID=3391835 RepID=UPI0039C96601